MEEGEPGTRLFPIMQNVRLLFYSFMLGGSTYYSLTSTRYSFTAANYSRLGFSNLIKEDRSVRVISNELNDTLSVFETKQTHIQVPSPDYIIIESFMLQYDTHVQSCICVFTFQS